MRFIGNKENVVDKIFHEIEIRNIPGDVIFDLFCGTTSVSRYFKKKGYQIISCDLLYFSFVLQQAYLVNNDEVQFERLLGQINNASIGLNFTPLDFVISHLNQIQPREGFIFNNYTPEGTSRLDLPRKFFTANNGKRIDAIRIQIEEWYQGGKILLNEYYILLACLIETVPFYANITGVYAAFHKKWDPRALKEIILRPIELITNDRINTAFCGDAVEYCRNTNADIFYLDPPYNQRQYAPNYHLLETIARYDDPAINGVTGMRQYRDQKSNFCNAKTALIELERIASCRNYTTLILSYNNEGIMKEEDIISVLNNFGVCELVEFQYSRYKSNNNGDSKTKKYINEQLYILHR